ncbi:beta-galactosidase [Cohnella boryungensis]|uniref:Beta-galactosidase n=1 Tax=Cohnella boryungensis TaxID=768479 RepID=A0ABV8SHB3_9BACL
MFKREMSKMLYGGDYNPEQWPKEIWQEDMRLFKLAGVDIATLNVFSWALNQPDENTYDFGLLDEIMDMLQANNVYACMGTGTAAHPAWMATRYPDVLAVDFEGRKRKFGRRHNSCANSPTYKHYSREMAYRLAERYKGHPALLLWHVNNEYGWRCYCDNCEAAFREWLARKYGTLEALNEAWYTRFWGHTFYDWNEIVLPNLLSEHLSSSNQDATSFQGISLDYARFNSDSILNAYKLERDAIKSVIPDAVVTTNFQGNGTYKPLDYFKWAKELDVIALDSYPPDDSPASYSSMRHDLMRGLKGGAPFMLMESCPSQLNWKPQNPLKRPGVSRLWSYQAIARGADSIMYFQMRRSAGAFEKFHGAMIDHSGHEHTRVFRECAQVGRELGELGDALLGARTPARAAIVFDWDNWWAVEYSSGLTDQLKYLQEVQKYYDAFHRSNIAVDFVGTEFELGDYDLVVAPVLYMVKEGYAEKLERFVEAGGTLLTTCFSGIVDESDRIPVGGYPGKLRKLLGVWVEEIDALLAAQRNLICVEPALGELAGQYECSVLCDVVHPEGAEVLATFGREFYQGQPALTRHAFGKGEAWYIATSPEPAFLERLILQLCASKGIEPLLETPYNVEATYREKDGRKYLFILNHNDKAETVNIGPRQHKDLLDGGEASGELTLEPKGLKLLQIEE